MEVISTSPSGIIAVSDAIVLTTACTHVPLSHACTQPPATIICALSTSRPIGPMPQPTHFSTRSIEVRSSDETSENRFASPANLFAYESAPTRVTCASPSPATTTEPGERLIAVALVDGVGLAGQHRLVDLQGAVVHDDGVGGHLVAGTQHEDVVEHDFRRGDLELLPVATHPRARGVQQGEPVERALGAELLDAADDRVRERREAEQRVLPAAEQQKDEEAGADDRVEQREDVGADDVPDAAAGIRGERVGACRPRCARRPRPA